MLGVQETIGSKASGSVKRVGRNIFKLVHCLVMQLVSSACVHNMYFKWANLHSPPCKCVACERSNWVDFSYKRKANRVNPEREREQCLSNVKIQHKIEGEPKSPLYQSCQNIFFVFSTSKFQYGIKTSVQREEKKKKIGEEQVWSTKCSTSAESNKKNEKKGAEKMEGCSQGRCLFPSRRTAFVREKLCKVLVKMEQKVIAHCPQHLQSRKPCCVFSFFNQKMAARKQHEKRHQSGEKRFCFSLPDSEEQDMFKLK